MTCDALHVNQTTILISYFQTQAPQPQTPNPKPQTTNPKPQTPNPKPCEHASARSMRTRSEFLSCPHVTRPNAPNSPVNETRCSGARVPESTSLLGGCFYLTARRSMQPSCRWFARCITAAAAPRSLDCDQSFVLLHQHEVHSCS